MAPARHLILTATLLSLALLVSSDTPESQAESDRDAESDLDQAGSVAVAGYQIQSVVAPRSKSSDSEGGKKRYGYPYLIAPTLAPLIHSRADDDEYENEAIGIGAKPFGSRLGSSSEELGLKKSQKKFKPSSGFGYEDSEEDSSTERWFRAYKEPTYRNFDELESIFRPRRIDGRVRFADFGYGRKQTGRPVVSPRDPYLSPSDEPTDGFYPTVPKVKSFNTFGSTKPDYGGGSYFHSHPTYDGPPKYTPGDVYDMIPPKYGPGSSHYNTPDTQYNYNEEYHIESNKPITGDIRKRLLDYAGASDLYRGEPDYLKEVARNKNKYRNIRNYYYPYGGPGNRDSFREHTYADSEISAVIKKMRGV